MGGNCVPLSASVSCLSLDNSSTHLGWQGGTSMTNRLRRHQSIPRGRSPTRICPNPKCNNRLYLTDHQCKRCGTLIDKAADRTPDNVPCPHCREFIPFDSETCPKCKKPTYRPPPTPETRPTVLPDRPWIPTSPTKKVSVPPPSIDKPPAVIPDNTQEKPSTTPLPSSENRITWMDSFKISIAVAPFIHTLLVNLSKTTLPYWTHYICTLGMFGITCP